MFDPNFFLKIKHSFFFERSNKKRFFLFFILIIVLLVVIAGFSVKKEFDHIEADILDQSKSTAELSSLLVGEHLNGLVDVATSLSSRPLVERGVEKEKWSDVEAALSDVPEIFHYVTSVAILDKEGTLRGIIPSSPELLGKNFSYRDYFQAVSKDWQPHVSPVFNRRGGNQEKIVSVAVPIRSIDDSRVTGIMSIGVNLNEVTKWGKDISGGMGDMVYFVDQKEHAIVRDSEDFELTSNDFHKKLSRQALRESSGSAVVYDKTSMKSYVVAHSQIARHGWGVVFMRPADLVFAEKSSASLRIVLPWAITLIFISSFVYYLLKDHEELRLERDHEQLFLDSIGDGVIAIDRSWNITLWNRAACTITGWHKEEVLGKPLRSIVKFLKEPEREEHFSFIEDAIISGNVRSVERGLILVKKDGSEVAISDSAASVVGARGESEGAIIVFRDVTKDRESERMRSDFAYAAHQLRTPVTEALWNIETAQTERAAKKRNESLEVAHEAILSVKDLEEHLITVSEIERGIVVLRTAHISLRETLDDLSKMLLPKAKANDVTLVFDTSLMPEAVHTDKKLLKGALFELVENAILYNHKGEKAVVRISIQDGNLIFEVEDHGVGIPLEEQAIVFTKFFRGSNRGTRVAGSGLGLYVAKEYIKLLDGKIWFNSEDGEGTTFFISIPVK